MNGKAPFLFSAALTVVAVTLMVTLADSPATGAGTNADAFRIDVDPAGNGNRVNGGLGTGDAGEGDMDGPGCLDDGNPTNGVGLGEDDDQDGFTDEGCPVLGTIEDCARINENGVMDADEDAVDTLFIDVIAENIPASNPMFGFSFEVSYPNAVDVIDGGLDMNREGLSAGKIDAADDGTFLGIPVIDGRLDVAAPFGTIDDADDGTILGVAVVNGFADLNANGNPPTPSTEDNDEDTADRGGLSRDFRVAGVIPGSGAVSDSRYLLFANPNSGAVGTQELDQPGETTTVLGDNAADGLWTADDLDATTDGNGDTVPDTLALEDGSGVLKRIAIQTLPGAVDGVNFVKLVDSYHLDPTNTARIPDVVAGASIAINVSCSQIQGNVDCSTAGNAVSAVDALKVLRFSAQLPVTQIGPEPDACPNIGTAVGPFVMGNVDCSSTGNPVSAVDALKILRFSAQLPVTQIGPEPDACPDINTPLNP